jgi:hypothetical protein
VTGGRLLTNAFSEHNRLHTISPGERILKLI